MHQCIMERSYTSPKAGEGQESPHNCSSCLQLAKSIPPRACGGGGGNTPFGN